jgi:hypothetical protein
MKLFFSIVLIFILGQGFSQIDSLSSFPTIGSYWYTQTSWYGGQEHPCNIYDLHVSDTTISGKIHHRMERYSQCWSWTPGTGSPYQNFDSPSPFASDQFESFTIIEDTVGRWFRDSIASDRLLCDMSLSLGDTLLHMHAYGVPMIVDSIDSVHIGHRYVKRMRTRFTGASYPSYDFIFVDGVGRVGETIGFEEYWNLYCFTGTNNTWYYNHTQDSLPAGLISCEYKNDIKENGLNYKLGPNPFHTFVEIDFAQPFTGSVRLYNAQGQLVKSVEVLNCATKRFDFGSISNGLYSISLIGLNGQKSFAKLLKIQN